MWSKRTIHFRSTERFSTIACRRRGTTHFYRIFLRWNFHDFHCLFDNIPFIAELVRLHSVVFYLFCVKVSSVNQLTPTAQSVLVELMRQLVVVLYTWCLLIKLTHSATATHHHLLNEQKSCTQRNRAAFISPRRRSSCVNCACVCVNSTKKRTTTLQFIYNLPTLCVGLPIDYIRSGDKKCFRVRQYIFSNFMVQNASSLDQQESKNGAR